jgi:hypothetical protein
LNKKSILAYQYSCLYKYIRNISGFSDSIPAAFDILVAAKPLPALSYIGLKTVYQSLCLVDCLPPINLIFWIIPEFQFDWTCEITKFVTCITHLKPAQYCLIQDLQLASAQAANKVCKRVTDVEDAVWNVDSVLYGPMKRFQDWISRISKYGCVGVIA